jgi:hypothetical protein
VPLNVPWLWLSKRISSAGATYGRSDHMICRLSRASSSGSNATPLRLTWSLPSVRNTLPSTLVFSGSDSTAVRSHGDGSPASHLMICVGCRSAGMSVDMYRTSGTRAVCSLFQK